MTEQGETIRNHSSASVTIFDFQVLPQEADCETCRAKIKAIFLPEGVCASCAGVWPEGLESEVEATIPSSDAEDESWWPSTHHGA